ncbi:putative minor capsid protein [Eel River basin pequenovirus]|nr:putative minor capsid protein [Eel River basin pequenovirus]
MGFLKKIIGGALGALGSSGGPLSSIGPMIGKIAGIPMPGDPRTGADLGKDARAYFDEAFPGTNPWERLGSSYGGGAVEVAKQQTKSQEQLQARELRTREKIAKIQARAQTTSAAVAHGPEAVTALDSFSRTGRVGNFNTPTTIAWKKLQPELDNIAADTRLKQTGAYKNMQEAMLTGAKGAIEKAKVPFCKAAGGTVCK